MRRRFSGVNTLKKVPPLWQYPKNKSPPPLRQFPRRVTLTFDLWPRLSKKSRAIPKSNPHAKNQAPRFIGCGRRARYTRKEGRKARWWFSYTRELKKHSLDDGVTGMLKFDKNGDRIGQLYNIINVKKRGSVHVGRYRKSQVCLFLEGFYIVSA